MIRELHNLHTGEILATDPHQLLAYDHLVEHELALLFLEMSLAKTVISATYVHDMIYTERAFDRVLIIAPDKVARDTWPTEFDKWAHLAGSRFTVVAGAGAKQREAALAKEADIVIVSTDALGWLLGKYITQAVSKNTGLAYGSWRGTIPFDCVLIDESSLFKSQSSQRYKMLERALRMSRIKYRIAMTGTPASNGYTDLWAQVKLIDGGERLGETFEEFESKYFKTRGNGMIVYEYIPKEGAIEEISAKIADITLALQAKDTDIQLPELEIIDELLELSDFDRETYDELEREYCLEFFDQFEPQLVTYEIDGEIVEDWIAPQVTAKTAADLTNKLLQLSGGAIYEDRTDPKAPRVWHEINTLKIDVLRQIVEEVNDNMIVVYQYRHELERILAAFPYAQELGKGNKTREDIAAWNRGEIKMLVIHPAGAGHGLNLQFGGCEMLFFTPTYNLEHWLQTIARLVRRGGLHKVTVRRLLTVGTRDMEVCKRVKIKDSDQKFLMNENKKLRAKYGK